MKYLIVKYAEESCECEPICVTDDKSKYGIGYLVYEIKSNGKLKLIKDYDIATKTGSALYSWNNPMYDYVKTRTPDNIYVKWEGKERTKFSKSEIRDIIKQAHFAEDIDYIIKQIKIWGTYSEEVDGKWIVFGEYRDTEYDTGY